MKFITEEWLKSSESDLHITLACQILNWEPKVPLKEGLEKTIVYFDQLLTSEISRNSKLSY